MSFSLILYIQRSKGQFYLLNISWTFYFSPPPRIYFWPLVIITTAQCILPMCSLIFLKSTLLLEQYFKTTNLLILLSHLKPFSNSQLPLGYNPNSWDLHRNACILLPFQSWALSSVQHFLHFPTGTLPSYPTFDLSTSSYSSYRFQLRNHPFQDLFPEHPRLGAPFFSAYEALWTDLTHRNY